jgi:hypothetical protein
LKRFAREDVEIWVGSHHSMGVLVLDPRAQLKVPMDKVRLYVIAQRRMATFLKEIVLRSLSTDAEEDLNSGANVYFALRGRFTHCYDCKRDLNSIDFSVCSECGWIMCICGACGCGYLSQAGP